MSLIRRFVQAVGLRMTSILLVETQLRVGLDTTKGSFC